MLRTPIITESYRGEFLAAVCCFALAAAAGVALRFVGAGFLLPDHVDYSNLRRAHSHLMLFGWVTPALFALVASRGPSSPAMRTTIRATIVLGLASFAPFLLWGYQSASLGDARVPVSVIVSTLNMVAWYVFAGLYVRMRSRLRRRVGSTAVAFWDGAILLLVVGSAGAWARGAFIGLGIDDPFLTTGAVEFFLSTFVDGFLMLGILGFLLPRRARPYVPLLVVATLFEFPAFISSSVPGPIRVLGSVAVVVGGVALARLGVMLLRRRPLIGTLVVVLGLGKISLVSPAVADWAVGAGLRIPYLHLALLGAITLSLFRLAQERWPRTIRADAMMPAVMVALVALWPTTSIWPAALSREVGLLFTAIASAGPLLVAVGLLLRSRRTVEPEDPVFPLAAFDPVLPALPFDDADEG